MQHIKGPYKGAITEDGVLCALSSHLHLSTPSPVLRVVWHRVTTRHVTLEVGQDEPRRLQSLGRDTDNQLQSHVETVDPCFTPLS